MNIEVIRRPKKIHELPTRPQERFCIPTYAGVGIEREMGVLSRVIEQAARHNEPVLLAEIGPGNGPELTIVAGVHGNETIGLEVVATLLQHAQIDKGTLRLVIANTPAIVAGRRFVERDLNRVAPGNADNAGELALAPKLLDLLDGNMEDNFVIDLHTASVESPSFVIVNSRNEKALQLAEQTQLQNIVLMKSDDFGTQKSGSITENIPSGIGIGIELGKHRTKQAYQDGMSAVENVMIALGMIKGEESTQSTSPTYYKITGRSQRPSDEAEVVFQDEFKNFHPVSQGQDIYSVVDEDGYITKTAKATQPFVPVLISTLSTNPLFLIAKQVHREDLLPVALRLEEFKGIKSASDFSLEVQDKLYECVKSAFGRVDFEREDTLNHLQGDYFQIIYDGEKIAGFSSLELGNPRDLVGVSDSPLADVQGGYFAAAVLAGDYQGKGLYTMMNDRRFNIILSEGAPLLFTRTQNPRVEEGITRLLNNAVSTGKIKGFSLSREYIPEFYGRSLTGYIPHSSVPEVQQQYSNLNYQAGDAYVLFFSIER